MTNELDTGNARPKNLGAMILIGATYPLFAHMAVLSGRPMLVAASIGLLALLVLFPWLRLGRPLAWVLLLASAVGLYRAATSGHTLQLLFLPPILINGFMAWIFGNTLRHGRVPLIERAMILLRGATAVTRETAAYARRLTLVWAVLFVLLATTDFILAALANPGGMLLSAGVHPGLTVPLGTWSLFANVLGYLIVAALFAIEYQVRRRRFPQQTHWGFLGFMRRLAGVSAMFRPTNADPNRPPMGTPGDS